MTTPITPQDNQLEQVQTLRFNLITDITKNGPPQDTESQYVLLAALRDAGAQAMQIKKLAVESKALDQSANALALMSEVLSRSGSFKHPAAIVATEAARDIPQISTSVPMVEVVVGELDINPPQVSYDQFVGNS